MNRIKQDLARLAGKRVRSQPIDVREHEVEIKPKVKRKNSREIGNRFERVVAKGFMAWFGGVWKRTPQSGGWAKGSDFGVSGDLVCTVPNPFHVECKDHKTWLFDDLITGTRQRGKTSLISWWEQACRETPRQKINGIKKHPLLVFHRKRGGDFVMMREEYFDRLDKRTGGTAQFLPMIRFYMEGLKYGTGPVVVLALKDLFRKVRPPKSSPNFKTWKWKK